MQTMRWSALRLPAITCDLAPPWPSFDDGSFAQYIDLNDFASAVWPMFAA